MAQKPLGATITKQVIVDGVHTLALTVKPLATLVANQPPIVPMHGKIARAANPRRVGLGEGAGLGVCRARGMVDGRARVGLWGV